MALNDVTEGQTKVHTLCWQIEAARLLLGRFFHCQPVTDSINFKHSNITCHHYWTVHLWHRYVYLKPSTSFATRRPWTVVL